MSRLEEEEENEKLFRGAVVLLHSGIEFGGSGVWDMDAFYQTGYGVGRCPDGPHDHSHRSIILAYDCGRRKCFEGVDTMNDNLKIAAAIYLVVFLVAVFGTLFAAVIHSLGLGWTPSIILSASLILAIIAWFIV